jgi:Trypsin-like peptidase domain
VTAVQPRSPGLRRLMDAVVRVRGATGVMFLNGDVRLIATAWHVVKTKPANAVVRRGAFSFVASMLGHNEETDLAILADDPRLPGSPLALLDADMPLAPGDEIHIGGFPAGWAGEPPLLSSGTVAGNDGELWLNADTTWGHSGGPVCAVTGEVPYLAGIVRGGVGSLRYDLERLVSELTTSAQKLGNAANAQGGGGFAVGTAMGIVSFGAVAETTGKALAALAEFGAAHFRTGYTRAASVDGLRKLL